MPVAEHLFQVQDDVKKKLPEKLSQSFHNSVARLLFIAMCARTDVLTLIPFLTKRFREPDEDDWGKFKRGLKYLMGIRHMKLVLTIDLIHTNHWYVDALYGTHSDCKVHTGMIMAMGFGALMSMTKRHKINVKSSTEAELVGLDDDLGDILWGKYFLEALGYHISHNIFHQDNKSTILLATNGTCSKKTNHIKHKLFLVKDKSYGGDMEIKWTPTEKMWCDILTKPKQGQVFWEFREYLMNVLDDYEDEDERLFNRPDILPRAKVAPTLSENDKSILLKWQRKQKRAIVYFAKNVLFENRSTTKDIQSNKRLLSQKVQKQTSTPLNHSRSVLDYYNSRRSALSLKERSRAKSVVRHRTRGQTKSASGLAQYQSRSDEVAIQWGIYQRYIRISSLPNQRCHLALIR